MPSLELLATLIAGIGNVLLAFYTYIKNPKNATAKYFALFAVTVSLYLIANYLSLQQSTLPLTFLWIKTVMSIAGFLNLTFFFLTATYPKSELKIKPFIYWSLFIFTLAIVVLSYSNLIFTTVELKADGPNPIPGPAIVVFLIHTALLLGGGFYLLLRNYRTSNELEKNQIRAFFLGSITMFSLIILTNLLLVLIFNIGSFVNMLPFYTLIFISFVSYSIVKHGLFDLRVVATQALIVVILIILFAKLFISRSWSEAAVDLFVFIAVVIFGVLLIRSVVREIGQRKELEILNGKLKELDQRKNEFLNMASHELRAPMTAIKGYISMIIEGDAGEIPEKARGYLTDAQGVTDRLIRLVNNMLNVSRIEENRLVYQVDTINLSEVTREVFSEFQGEAVRKGLQFDVVIPQEAKDKVTVDPDRIHEVVANYISNAIKYTEKGSVKVILSNPTPTTIRCDVTDTGPGISSEEQKKLFQKFVRAESAIGKTVGTGLGLYISKLLVEKFNGRIGLNSELGKGSTFWFELPLAGTASAPQIETFSPNAKPAAPVSQKGS